MFPGWLAVIEHAPTPTIVNCNPDTEQTADVLETRLRVRPEVAVATSEYGAVPYTWLAGAAKLIDC